MALLSAANDAYLSLETPLLQGTGVPSTGQVPPSLPWRAFELWHTPAEALLLLLCCRHVDDRPLRYIDMLLGATGCWCLLLPPLHRMLLRPPLCQLDSRDAWLHGVSKGSQYSLPVSPTKSCVPMLLSPPSELFVIYSFVCMNTFCFSPAYWSFPGIHLPPEYFATYIDKNT